jgi:hypothetical protein
VLAIHENTRQPNSELRAGLSVPYSFVRIKSALGAVMSKQEILDALADLPDDADAQDALDRLYLLYKVEQGIKQADAGQLIGQDEARQRMAKWLK